MMRRWRKDLKKNNNRLNTPEKANKILNGILVVLTLIAIQIWHLAVIQHDQKVEEARKPQRRLVVERADRATICDRFGSPLAMNKVKYQVGIIYEEIREIPRWTWKRDEDGKKGKYFARKEYILRLSQLLGAELDMDPSAIEDLIHAKAAVLGNVPCLVKDNIPEEKYFHLKMMEKDWPGIRAEIAVHRYYPKGSVGGEVVGYLGAISKTEYDAVTEGLRELRAELEDEEKRTMPEDKIKLKIKELESKAYSITGLVGKAGIEAAYDVNLRGLHGKTFYLADTCGRFLSELPGGEEATPGECIRLTISAELQEYGEKLLADYDQNHKIRSANLLPEKQPWIKGGGIVVMDPNTGEIMALSAFPRFDPNDFVISNSKVHKWLEDENYLSAIWDQKSTLDRERLNETQNFYIESLVLDWPTYLEMILPKNSPVRKALDKHPTLRDGVVLQLEIEKLCNLFSSDTLRISIGKILDFIFQDGDDVATGEMVTLQERDWMARRCQEESLQIEQLKKNMAPYFQNLPLNSEKILLVDLYRLCIDCTRLSPHLVFLFGDQNLAEYRQASAHLVTVIETVRRLSSSLFDKTDFPRWRDQEFKTYLSAKRNEEKIAKKHARPYTDYLELKRKELFQTFWSEHQWELLYIFLTGCKPSENTQLDEYRDLFLKLHEELAKDKIQQPWVSHYSNLQKIVAQIENAWLIPYLKSLRGYSDLNRPLLGRYSGLRFGPQGEQQEKHLATAFYPTYGFGFARSQAYRQAATIGSIFKLVPAYETLKQSIMKGNSGQLNPLVIIDDKHRQKNGNWNVGFTAAGRPIPMFYKSGRIPRSDHTGLGKIDLIHALEMSSNPYFSLLAGDIMDDPEDLTRAASLFGFGEKTGIDLPGEYAGKLPHDVAYNRTGLYAFAIGQHTLIGTPLQTAVMLSAIANGGKILRPKIVKQDACNGTLAAAPEVKWQIFLPKSIQHMLLTGMRQVIFGEKGTARSLRSQFPSDFLRNIVGKTSTAESIEKISLDGVSGWQKFKHVWFGAIAYKPDDSENFSNPELVVVVYLRFGEWGWEAAPIAIKMIKKWYELQARER